MVRVETHQEFMMIWAKKAFDLQDYLEGTMSGGIEPPRIMENVYVTGNDTVEISYTLPETAGYLDQPYNVIDPHRLRTDEFKFADGEIWCNGELFPNALYENEPWTKEDVLAFKEEYTRDFEAYREAALQDFEMPERKSSKPRHIGEMLSDVLADIKPQDTRLDIFTWESEDEDGKTERGLEDITELSEDKSASRWTEELCQFLGQTDETYIDKWGVVHEIYQGKDQPFAYYFEVHDGDWQEVIGNMGERLDDSLNKDMPEDIRQGFADIYDYAMKQVKLQELSTKANKLNDLAESKGISSYSMVDENYSGEPELGEEDYEAYREAMDLEV